MLHHTLLLYILQNSFFSLNTIAGILSQESVESLKKFGPTYIPASYVKFIESAGARVVPILVNQTDSYYKQMFQSLNGFVIHSVSYFSLYQTYCEMKQNLGIA